MSDKNSARTKHGGKSKKPSARKPEQSMQSLQKKFSRGEASLPRSAFPQKTIYVKPVIPDYLRSVVKKAGDVIDYVLDTNIIMHYPHAIFRFDEHNVHLVEQMWKELDEEKSKSGSDTAVNVRTTVRYLADLVKGKTRKELSDGLVLVPPADLRNGKPHTGKVFWDFSKPDSALCDEMDDIHVDENHPDHRILLSCLKLQKEGKKVVLISNDKNFRVLAAHAGVVTEEYFGDAVELLPSSEKDIVTGFHQMDEDFWAKVGDKFDSGNSVDTEWYEFTHSMFRGVYINQFLIIPGHVDSEPDLILKVVGKPSPHKVDAEVIFINKHKKIAKPLNVGQGCGLNLLVDQNIPCVALIGAAGSGKTYLALAVAIAGIKAGWYDKIIITRSLADVDKEIGFLPGTEEEKMQPWLAAISDNLEMIINPKDTSLSKEEQQTQKVTTIEHAMLLYNIQFRSLNYMRGRSFTNAFIIHDESQNTTLSQMKTLTTRVGEGSKIVHLGNVAQIDSRYLTAHTNGLSAFIRRSLETQTPLVASMTLEGVVRSPLAEWAEQNL